MGCILEKAKVFRKSVDGISEKSSDFDIIISEVMKLPQGQLKKILTEPVLEVLRKYGVDI